MKPLTFHGNVVDIVNKRMFFGDVIVSNKKIVNIKFKSEVVKTEPYILPGFVDAHVHVESSMLIPSEFARIACKHGTIGVIADPHEIANVAGLPGILSLVENGEKSDFKFYFGAPSCVPAIVFEPSGSVIGENEIEWLFKNKNLKLLSEVMNFPAVLENDPGLLKKIKIAKKYNALIDGHSPGLSGYKLEKYIAAGISTDHEATSLSEATEKIEKGMKIIIRNGSAAKNFNALHSLIENFPDSVMLCTDDCHPNDLLKGHINLMIKEGLNKGHNIYNLLRAATLNPINHYGLNIGLLRKNDQADFIIVDNLNDFNIKSTIIDGKIVFQNDEINMPYIKPEIINNFSRNRIGDDNLKIISKSNTIKVIEVLDGEIYTKTGKYQTTTNEGMAVSNLKEDILKLVVLSRYNNGLPQIAFVKGFGSRMGALASSIAHDSHNIISVGVDDESMVNAINNVIKNKGGIAVAQGEKVLSMQLKIGGLMSDEPGERVAEKYISLLNKARELGVKLHEPFMTLSFLALPVIPELKLTSKGLFDVQNFALTSLFNNDLF